MPTHSPLTNPVFKKLFLAQLISIAGTGITTIALALLAWNLAEDEAGKILGTALAIKMIAYVVLAPAANSISTTISRKRLLVWLDILRAPLLFYLPFVSTIWEIYLILFLVSACSAAFTPVFQTTIADIISDEEQYLKALSYSRLAFDLEQLLSPTLAAILLTVMSFNGLFLLDGFSFLLSASLIGSAAIPLSQVNTSHQSAREKLIFGVTAYLKTPRLRAIFFLYAGIAAISSVMITGTVVYVGTILEKADTYTAIAMAISGGGSMSAALILPKLLGRIHIRHILYSGAFLAAAGGILAGFGPQWHVFLILWFFMGAGLSFMQVPVGSLIKMSSSKADLSAYFAANFSLSHLCWLFAYPMAGFAASIIGIQATFLLMGGVAVCTALISWKLYPVPDEIFLEHSHDNLEHLHVHDEQASMVENSERYTHKHRFVIDQYHKNWP